MVVIRSLRFDGESDDAFRERAERTAMYARQLVDSALANHCIQQFIASPDLPYTEEDQRRNPTVRVEYDQAFAIGGIGECLHATRNKHWGTGPCIRPLRSDDPVDPTYVLYVFRENSRYNLRFEQRKRMKQLLGRKLRPLVTKAKYKRHSWEIFREHHLSPKVEQEIAERLGLTAKEFWRAARGQVLYSELPPKERQLRLDLGD